MPRIAEDMDLQTLTAGRHIRVGLHAGCKVEAIEQLLDCLLEDGAIAPGARDEILEAILEREKRLSTGLQHGIAIPHGTTRHVTQETAALGIFPAGVPFETVDGQVPQIVILLVTPKARRHRHVTNLATLARQLMVPTVRARLLAAESPEEALAAIEEA